MAAATKVEPSAHPRGARPFELRHVPALDGLRGLAVAGVLVFHGGHLTGGYLGVDLFFVLSGFLITSLLLRERAATGTIRLGAFWVRRARRLLPAIFGVLVGVAAYARVWASPYELGGLRADALATVFYVANWRAVLSGHGYWDLFTTPSPLQHTWSLAIEEQFYVLWPLLVAGVAVVAARRRAPPAGCIAVLAGVGAVASWAWMTVSYTPGADPSRLYFGTDTRAGSILAGAALAAVLSVRGWGRVARPATPWVWGPGRYALDAAGLGALAVLAYLWLTLDGQSETLYRSGFVVSAGAVLVLIAAAAHPQRGIVAQVLSLAPLRGLGLISYGLYLWHWPVFVVVQLERDHLGLRGWWIFVVQAAVSLLFALISYRIVERPIRFRGFAGWGSLGRPLMPAAAVAAVVVVLAATLGAEKQPEFAYGAGASAAPDVASRGTLPTIEDEPAPGGGHGTGSTGAPAPLPVLPTAEGFITGPLPRPPGRPPRVLVVGDSVAYYLGDGIQKQPALGIQVGNQAMFKCSMGREFGEWGGPGIPSNPEAAECRQWERIWGDAVNRFKPDAVLFIFGGPPQNQLRLGDGWHPPCSEPFLRYWRGEVEAAVRVLTARGATLFLAPEAYPRFPWLPEQVDDNVECINRVHRSVAAEHRDHVRILPIDTWTCPERRRCVDEVEGVKVRPDGIHYDGEGAKVAGRWLAGQLFEGPPSA